METVRLSTVVEKDGEIIMTGLPYKKGDEIEMILQARPAANAARQALTARLLRHSGLIGMWKGRDDIQDSAAYARRLREEAQRRHS